METNTKRKQNSKELLEQARSDLNMLKQQAEILKDQSMIKEVEHIRQQLTIAQYNKKKKDIILQKEIGEIKKLTNKVNNFYNHENRKIFIKMFIVFLPKLLLYVSGIITLQPRNEINKDLSLYVTIAIITAIIWSFFFYCVYRVYRYIYTAYVIPFIERNPRIRWQTRFFTTSVFTFTCSQPLAWFVMGFSHVIDPSWSKILVSIYNLLIETLTGSILASFCTIITIAPVSIIIYKKIQKFLKKPDAT